MADKPSGRRRAAGKVNILEQLELRNQKNVAEKSAAKSARAQAKAAKSAERIARMLEVEQSVAEGRTRSFSSRIVTGVSKQTFRRNVISTLTFSVAAGLFATFALPAYAFSPEVTALAGIDQADAIAIAKETQGLTVVQVKSEIITSRGGAKTVGASSLRSALLGSYRSWSGYSAEDYLKNPPYDSVTSAGIVKVAAKYIGVPYVFGGSTPAGFDCSGYSRYVFAQFGIKLEHSVSAQLRRGKLIRQKDAQPGDLVIARDHGHLGIYAGGWNWFHAPQPGDSVKLAEIYLDPSQVVFVRIYK